MPCSAWPNSWNIVVTSSQLISIGWPGAGLVKFSTLKTTGLVPRRYDWLTRFDIQAPPVLVVALPRVDHEDRQLLAVCVVDLEHPHVRAPGRDVLPLLEGQSVKLVGGVEDAVLEHLVELEILLQLVAIDRVALLADLLGVEVPVGRRRLERRALRLGERDGCPPIPAAPWRRPAGASRSRKPTAVARSFAIWS